VGHPYAPGGPFEDNPAVHSCAATSCALNLRKKLATAEAHARTPEDDAVLAAAEALVAEWDTSAPLPICNRAWGKLQDVVAARRAKMIEAKP
jgi:hypothetical protein